MSDEPIDLVPVSIVQRLEKDKNDEENLRRKFEKELNDVYALVRDLKGEYVQRPQEMVSRLEWFKDRATQLMEKYGRK